MDKLLNYRIENSSPVEVWRCQEQMGQEKQLEMIRNLQATVENQGKLLKAMADRLKISDIEDQSNMQGQHTPAQQLEYLPSTI